VPIDPRKVLCDLGSFVAVADAASLAGVPICTRLSKLHGDDDARQLGPVSDVTGRVLVAVRVCVTDYRNRALLSDMAQRLTATPSPRLRVANRTVDIELTTNQPAP
jgi:hypothetical protein